jgi:hypothetical protein
MKLYRGDKIYNEKTKPYLYRNNGLLTKAFGSGCNPENIEIQGLLESIRKHVKPEGVNDKIYYDVTDFLSFSESRKRALFWCSDMDRFLLESTDNYKETRYLFSLSIDDHELVSHGKGIYTFTFYCNPKLKCSDSGREPHLSLFEHLHNSEICPVCNNYHRKHKIILINSYEYLSEFKNHSKYKEAINFAKKDKEWLVLPSDPLGNHRSARIQRADFWSAEHFKITGEKRPNLNCL